ncbi:MAG: Fic/DOC family N-terminal domain-containing protein [Anaerolineaceae bacterium]|nr:Fic/DOC family N-terminal domain-containing protein [Anaerolineaceae bacterium]
MISDLYAFPPDMVAQTDELVKQLIMAHRRLAELKGVAPLLPNQEILLNTLTLQEAKDSSALENIITSHDELFKQELDIPQFNNAAAKEVSRYSEALKHGFERIKSQGQLTLDDLITIQTTLIIGKPGPGIRIKPGTNVVNKATGEIIYTPPQDHDQIVELLERLIDFFNEDSNQVLDPLVKMALIHYQFEKIHPFYDGNGRTGRILNLLYLVKHGLLDLPILYLSRFIVREKSTYLAHFREDPIDDNWETWLKFMLRGLENTSSETIETIHKLKNLMVDYQERIKTQLPRVYSLDLLTTLFKHPYTKIDFVIRDVGVQRAAAARYLDTLADAGFLEKQKLWRSSYYINKPLFELLQGR